MKRSAGESSSQKTQTTSETSRPRGFFGPRARALILASVVVSGGAAVATSTRANNAEKAAEPSPVSVANTEARVLAQEINDIYAHGPKEYERVEQPSGEGTVRQVTARGMKGVHFMQLKSSGPEDMTGKNLKEIFVSDTLLDPATHQPAPEPSYSVDITFGDTGVTGITVQGLQAHANYPNSQQLSFDKGHVYDQNGQSVDAGQMIDVFNGAHAEVLNQKAKTVN